MAFTAKISDPAVGGTYMTLLNTITNLGMIYRFIYVRCLVGKISYGWLRFDISIPVVQ